MNRRKSASHFLSVCAVLWITFIAAGCGISTPASISTSEPGTLSGGQPNIASRTPTILEKSRTFTLPATESTPSSTTTPIASILNPALHTQALPEGAIARLGSGDVNQVAVSPAAKAVAAATTIGVYLYRLGEDGHTLEETWFGPTTTPMRSVAFSPDGKILASGSEGLSDDGACDPLQFNRPDGIITIWDTRTGEAIRDYPVSHCSTQFLVFSANGRKLVARGTCLFAGSDSGDSILVGLDLDTGEVLPFAEKDGQMPFPSVMSASISPDGTRIAAGYLRPTEEGTFINYVLIYDDTGQPVVSRLVGFEKPVPSLAFSPDGGLLAAGSEGGLVSLWDVSTGAKRQTLPSPGRNVKSINFSPSGRTMAVAYDGGTISLWDTSNWSRTRVLDGRGAGVLAFSPDEPALLSAAVDGPVIRWDLTSGEARHVYPFSDLFGISNIGTDMEISPDGKVLAAGGREGKVTLFDLQTLQPLRKFNIQAKHGTNVSFSPDGKTLAASADGTILLWNYHTGTGLLSLPGGNPVFSPDGKTMAYAKDNAVVLFDRISGKPVRSFPAMDPYKSSFASEGRFLAYAVEGGVALRDLTEEIEIRKWDIGNYGGMYIAAAPGKNILGIADLFHELLLLDIRDGSELPSPDLSSLYSLTRSVDFSPDGRMGAFASGNVTVWDLDTWKQIAVLSGHTCHATRVDFSPDGRILATSSYDDTILLWDLPKVMEAYTG